MAENFKKPKKIGILTSGGDAPGMNACIRSVVRSALYHEIEPVGIMRGYDGILDREFHIFNARSVANIIQRGGTILMASRSERFLLPEQRAAAFLNLRTYGIDALVALGGDGTMAGLEVFSKEHRLPVCGIPATIDNDLAGTDFSLGFDTAVNTALELVDRLRDTTSSYERVMLVEVMGRMCGQIALNVALAGGAEAVLLPEINTDIDVLADSIKKSHERGKTSQIVVVAEGESHGGAVKISKDLEKRLSIPVRYCILGHVQRGGMPSARDRILAGRLGAAAVEAFVNGQTSMMVGEVNLKTTATPIAEVIKGKRVLDPELVSLLSILAR